jgi:tRNA A-37 threonylcarbamoyl transferase component Bud32
VGQTRRIGAQGRYELIEEIDSGGMGVVWRGYDTVLDREVAVKRIRPDVIDSPAQAEELARRFQREARITARIGHHGVPQVFDAVLDGDSYDGLYLVMEYVRGIPLHAVIAAATDEDGAGTLPVSWAASIAAQICTVLSYAHAIPAVHRDLKPDNVLLAADGTVKVLDFGIAKVLRTDVTRLTATGSQMGTTRYMSPEQVDGGQVTPLSDLYALGCVLHELLTGQPVFDGDSDYRLMRQHMDTAPTPVRELRPDVPAELEALVLDLLAKVPEERPADAYEVYERLAPHLPVPGATERYPVGDAAPAGTPDPTVVYRRPNAPLRPTATALVAPEAAPPVAVPPVAARPDTALGNAIQDAYAHSAALADEGRFTQAADILRSALAPAAAALGPQNPRVLGLRQQRAAILMAGGDFRRARAEFDALAADYALVQGPASPGALECRKNAAHCRANLGETTAALTEFRAVLDLVSEKSDVSPTARELRRQIGLVLSSEGRREEAEGVLDALYEDVCVVLGEEHEETLEVAELLRRLRGAGT